MHDDVGGAEAQVREMIEQMDELRPGAGSTLGWRR